MLAAPEGLAQDRDVSLTREHQTVLIVSLYTMSKAAAAPPTSDWTAKHSTVLGDLIGLYCMVEPLANRLDDWRKQNPGRHHDEAKPRNGGA